jgi:hypothetical protein
VQSDDFVYFMQTQYEGNFFISLYGSEMATFALQYEKSPVLSITVVSILNRGSSMNRYTPKWIPHHDLHKGRLRFNFLFIQVPTRATPYKSTAAPFSLT